MGTSIYTKYPEDCRFDGLKVLNVGCGFDKFAAPNVVNVDLYEICAPDLVWDLNQTPLPYPDEYFDLIIANHILEHLENWWNLFNDLSRMLKINGRIEVWVPGEGSDSIFGYRDHVKEINLCSFFGIFQTFRNRGNAWAEEHARCDANKMKFIGQMTRLEKLWWLDHAPRFVKEFCRKHLRNVVVEQGFLFRKVTEEEWNAELDSIERRSKFIRLRAMQAPSVSKSVKAG